MTQIVVAERSTPRFGAHAVIERIATKSDIDRALKKRDPRLFLELQINLDQDRVWCVVIDSGIAEVGLVTIYEWRDPTTDEPINHPTFGIVDEIDRRLRRGPINVREIDARNKARQRKRVEEMRGHVVDVVTDFARHWGVGGFSIVPRSQQLMLTRARVRREHAEAARAQLDSVRRAEHRRRLLRELGLRG